MQAEMIDEMVPDIRLQGRTEYCQDYISVKVDDCFQQGGAQ